MASRIQNGENINSQTVWKNRLFNIGFREGLEGEEEAQGEPVIEDAPTDQETAPQETKPQPGTSTPGTPPPGEGASGEGASGKTEGAANKPEGGMFDRGLTSDANYKNVNLPSLVAPTRKSNSWKPPINQTYTSRPNGLNAKPGSTSDSIYSPANDQDFIRTTIAKIADIITPPPPVPLPKPTRPTESFQTNDTDSDVQEPLSAMDQISGNKLKSSSDVPEKQKRLISSWRNWMKDTTKLPKLGKAIAVTVNSIYETFYIPELIAVGIVNPSYNLSDIKSFYSREDYVAATKNHRYDQYNQDVVTLTKQIKLFVITAFSFFAVFNWWYLIIYTQHYLDINDFLVAEAFTPVNWILGPALGTTAGLNYFLLGKRLQKKFYESVMEPIVNNKWISFPVFLLVFMGLYQKFSKYTSASFEDVMKGEPNEFFKVLVLFGFFYYFFGVQSKALVSPFWVSLFRLSTTVGFIFSFIYLVILFILMMVMLKFSILFVILFFMFYSYWSIIILGKGDVPGIILRIIADTSETCDVPNPLKDPFIEWMTWFKKNLTHILIAIIYFGLIIQLLDDTSKNIVSPTVKGKCHAIYTLLLVVQIFMIIWINRRQNQMVNIDDILANVKDPNAKPDSDWAWVYDNTVKIGTIFKLVWYNITNSISSILTKIISLFSKTTSTTNNVDTNKEFDGVVPS